VVQADYLALANDLEQAQALASTLEIQLSGKTNELARFKLIWERTQADLAKFEHDLDTMRKERHSLANDAQRAYAYEHKFEKLRAVHEELTAKADRLESELVRERAAHVQTRAELEALRETPGVRPGGNGAAPLAGDLRRTLELLREQLDRVLGQPAGGGNPEARTVAKTSVERIDIEFGT
jgi:hypothetical protein